MMVASHKRRDDVMADDTRALEEDEAIRLSLTPHLHMMIAARPRRSSCCPQLFERASHTWWNPKFDTSILEEQYQKSSLATLKLRFQYALCYALVNCVTWTLYWVSTGTAHWPACIAVTLVLALAILALLLFSLSTNYKKYQLISSLTSSVLLMVVSLLPYALHTPTRDLYTDLSLPAMFAIALEILLMVYTMIPLPLYLAIVLCSSYSLIFEVLNAVLTQDLDAILIFVRTLLHISIHLIGAHIMIMSQVRMRGTFMSVGQSLLVRQQLELEKVLKEKMIHSVMPPKVADWLLRDKAFDEYDDPPSYAEGGAILRRASTPRSSHTGEIGSIDRFRPFNMHGMDNVSILFADIVGFTRMSSNKTAEQLVGLLNDLFGRFDKLCKGNGCEKISTLGDCYYSVSGCPEPRPDHATCCVNMGLAMITAIIQFDEDNNEDVNMRVGVHTGKVMCGIVGTKRFKFDVWSNDVTFANKMESTGKPGQVHISESTMKFLPLHTYIIEDGEPLNGLKTHFILGIVPSAKKSPGKCMVAPPALLPLGQHCHESTSPNNKDGKKAASLPNMLDCVLEADDKGRVVSKPSSDSGKFRRSLAPSIELLKLKLPRFSRAIEKAKSKTTSLPKISKAEKVTEWAEDWERMSSLEANSDGNATPPHLQPPTISAPPPSPNPVVSLSPTSANLSSSPNLDENKTEVNNGNNCHQLQNSWGDLADKDPRKDSGIRSRRSSIEAQLFAINGMSASDLLTQRVSGYSSDGDGGAHDMENGEDDDDDSSGEASRIPLNESLTRFHQMRKRSDLQLIKCVQQETHDRQYVLVSPLSQVTLFFLDEELEYQYRQQAHKPRSEEPRTLASSIYNTYCDILVTAIVYILVGISLFLLYRPSIVWLVLFPISSCWYLFLCGVCLYQVVQHANRASETDSVPNHIYNKLTRWKSWHACGASLLCLPLAAVMANYSCDNLKEDSPSLRFFCYLSFVAIVHFCNFTQLNCWMKNTLATAGVIVLLVLLVIPHCPCPFKVYSSGNETNGINVTLSEEKEILGADKHWFHSELIVVVLLLLMLVWLLNREFEISYRLSFHGSVMAIKDKVRVQAMKDQAEWLLHNIIPQHVANYIKSTSTSRYSENHKDAAVMFASIVNFNELYDETYYGGKEYLRLLNELVADFDELLLRPEFANIEKIKTIGSTYMAASGLNPELRKKNKDPYAHIYEIVEFSKEMKDVIKNFNINLIGFNLEMRIGLNHGDVTAGVIGTTKLYYDIWGDAVNIASRMDSTGVPNRVQVSEQCADILKKRYELELRGQVFVKGKDLMQVYLLKEDPETSSL